MIDDTVDQVKIIEMSQEEMKPQRISKDFHTIFKNKT